jgi:RNA polymerase sigma factor (sigma-70 family)
MDRGGRFFRPRLAFSAKRGRTAPAAQSDHAERFREVMLPHMDAAYNFARYLARDPVAAEDIVQDAFLRAFRAIDSWRGEAAKAWLLAIVRNAFVDWVKANRRELVTAEIEDLNIDPDTPESLLLQARDVAMLRTTVERLPEPFREALVLRELEELSYKEIALITAVPIGTVMSRLARARQMLSVLLLPTEEPERRAEA